MKYILLTITLLLSLTAFGQININRAKAPAAGPAPRVNIGTPDSFTTANGIEVFVVESHKVPKVNVSLVLKKTPAMEHDKVGYISMAGSMMRRGTKTKSKAELDKEIDFLGGSVSTSSGSANASSLTKNFDKIFSIFSDVILHPAFRDSELTKVKTRTLSALESEKDEPRAIMNNVVDVANYGSNHPYGEIETPETVKNIATKDLKKYYNTYWKPNIAYMAFVGDISVEHAKELVHKYLSSWEKGEVPKNTYSEPQKPAHTIVYVSDRPSAVQTNINITEPIELKPGAPDYFALRLMNQILGGGVSGWLFQDLREKHGFTYGAYSSIHSDPLVGSFSASAAVRTPVTDSSLMRFMYQLNRIKDSPVSAIKLDSAKNIISGHFALSLERPSRIAQFALNIARYDMPKDYYKNYLKSIAGVTIEDVQAMARKYISPNRMNIALVGNSKEFADALDKYGSVQYVDIYGNPVEAPVHKDIPEGVTARQVLRQYIDAIGGENKINGIKDLIIEASTEMQGQKITVEQKYLLPDKYLTTVKVPAQNMTVTKILVNGDKVVSQRMGQELPLDDEKKAALKQQANPFPETTFLNGKYDLKLSGVEEINGKEAYTLEVTDENGKETTYYFDTKTGLELRQAASLETPQGTQSQITDFSDYKETDGIMFPTSLKTKTGKMTMNLTVDSIKVNSGVSEEDFE